MAGSELRIARASPGLVWRAFAGDQTAGSVTAFLLPNDRWFVTFADCRSESYQPLLRAVAGNTGGDLYATVEDTDQEALETFTHLGFTASRRESNVLIPVDPRITGLTAEDAPSGVGIVSAADTSEDRLRLFDDALRQDLPGAEGWKWDPGDFHEETFGTQFDPATYLVASEEGSGEYVGLVRVWKTRGGPRLGLIAVTRPYRRHGLARILLARAFRVLHERGETEASAEVDDSNTASWALLRSLGARRTGGTVELVLPSPGR
jgi:GNAT superfamily N-acetyltransferase